MIKDDFKFVVEIIKSFFEQEDIKRRIQLIEDKSITGWEIWLQVEIAVYLEDHKLVKDMFREYQYRVDRRKTKEKSYMAIDFIFRKKGAARDKYIALEIKQNRSTSSCLRGMMVDINKISLVKNSEDDIRSMWSLGIHPLEDSDELKEKVNQYAFDFDIGLEENCFHTQKINQSNLAFTIF